MTGAARTARRFRPRSQDSAVECSYTQMANGVLEQYSAVRLRVYRRKLEGEEMRSPVDGKIAIFDLHPGDQVAPNGRILLIEALP